MDIVKVLRNRVASGAEIPKPAATEPFFVKSWGTRRGENALVYTIPNKRGGRRYEKGVTESELVRAYRQLTATGELTRSWFNANLPACAKEGGCNFTTIGGLLNLVGEAQYAGDGKYVKI